jgi:DNA (cytosine-5)-methyltransferase 1
MGTVRAGNGNETGGVPFVPVAFSGAFSNQGIERGMSPTLAGRPMASSTQTGVRRLTPVECARLQGFPDTYLDIPYRGKPACDGPKYKALGNSMAVPVMRWIGERIAAVESIL